MTIYIALVIILSVNVIAFWLIMQKTSLLMKKFYDYDEMRFKEEELKFQKNQKSLKELKELFDNNKEKVTNETVAGSTNNWESTRKAFQPMTWAKRVDNE